MKRPVVAYLLAPALVLLAMGPSAVAQRAAEADLSLDSLLNTRISAASKYAQTSQAAPGSVTIISSDDIRAYGYRNLQEVLESVRGFYVSNDRNFAYLGTRGFGRTTDYNSRVLMLIDGHSINDQLFGSAPIGAGLPLNLDAVERIEVVQGPGSALYGTGAMFAVINIVTRSATAQDGGSVRIGSGTAGERFTALTVGKELASRVAITGSFLLSDTKGNDQYYREFDTPANGNGIAHGLDWQRAASGYATLSWNGFRAQAGYRSYDKGIPTAPFGMYFGDDRAEAADRVFWGSVAMRHEWSAALSFSGRLYADSYTYDAVYPFHPGPDPFLNGSRAQSGGTELMLRWVPTSRLQLTLGTEDRLVRRAEYTESMGGPESSDDAPFHVLSAFAQGELQLAPTAMVIAGMRADRYSTVGSATTPRLGLIFTPPTGTTVKLLYGEAFRAPSVGQSSITAGAFLGNPDLEPERIATSEINVQQRVGKSILLALSGYRYSLENVIEQTITPETRVLYRNLSHANATGVEFQIDARPTGPIAAQLSYALQRTADAQGTLTNSPQHVANLGLTARTDGGLVSGLRLRYESGRRTLTSTTSSFVRTDGSISYRPALSHAPRWIGRVELGARVTNLFDVEYGSPGTQAHRQDVILADGRTMTVTLKWHY